MCMYLYMYSSDKNCFLYIGFRGCKVLDIFLIVFTFTHGQGAVKRNCFVMETAV